MPPIVALPPAILHRMPPSFTRPSLDRLMEAESISRDLGISIKDALHLVHELDNCEVSHA